MHNFLNSDSSENIVLVTDPTILFQFTVTSAFGAKSSSLLSGSLSDSVHSATVTISEIDDISRFSSKERFASYVGLVPRLDQSGSRDIKGHISKRGPSMLRFILIVASHTAIKRSRRFRMK